jgi:hypothetical protein
LDWSTDVPLKSSDVNAVVAGKFTVSWLLLSFNSPNAFVESTIARSVTPPKHVLFTIEHVHIPTEVQSPGTRAGTEIEGDEPPAALEREVWMRGASPVNVPLLQIVTK